MQGSFKEIISKIDSFTRKYYLNQIVRGSIYFLSFGLFFLLLILLLEHFGRFSSAIRTLLFYGSIGLLASILVLLILYPLSKYLRIGSTISDVKAAEMIGKHFPEVADKLKNLLQLNSKLNNSESELLLASIDQKAAELNPIPFSLAVKLGENKKYLKYLVFPIAIFLFVYLFQPGLISESSGRLIAHSKEYLPSAPYSLSIENSSLQAFKNQDFQLQVSASGKETPSRLMIVVDNEEYLMKQSSEGLFIYTFKNLQSSTNFFLTDGQFDSPDYQVEVITPPSLIDLEIEATYPPYLGKKNEVFKNSGDLSVTEGTRLRWKVSTEATNEVSMFTKEDQFEFVPSAEDEFTYDSYLYRSLDYGLVLSNSDIGQKDTVAFKLNVIQDLRPQISLNTMKDSSSFSRIYFDGMIKDDHGFSGLYFHSKVIGPNDSVRELPRVEIPINKELTQTKYYYAWDAASINLSKEQNLVYYFEVWDNDGVNGSKSAKTLSSYFSTPKRSEIAKQTEEANKEIKEELEKNIRLSQEINRDLEKLKQKMLNKKELGFQEKKQLEEVLEKQKQLKNSVEKLQNKQKQNNQLDQQFNPPNESIVEKQKQLEELFEKVMSDEMREMLAEMEKLMQDFQKDQLQNALEEMELNNEQLEKELDRNLELFKQLEVEKELSEAIEKLDELKEKQDKLEKETADKKNNKEELSQEQEELNKEFEELSEDLDNLEKKNEELEQPNKMEDTQSLEEQIKEDMKESLQQIQENNRSKANEQQQQSKQGMQELSESLNGMQMQMQSQQNAENLEDLRALLENLITLSFDQEDLMEELKKTGREDPRYVDLAQEQRKLKDDSKLIQDSLYALSKRVMALESIVNKEISSINYNMGKAIDLMGDRSTSLANNRQQLAMTSINNLALILDEAVQNMQSQMQSQGQCDKPGEGNPKPGMGQNPGNLKKLQQQLNQQLESLKKAMEEGKKPGDGKGGSQGAPKMSKEIAQMAAKQAAIRRSLEQMQEQIGDGQEGGSGSLKKIADMMEQTETDLVNKSITNETMLRQQEILSRLLQSEKAEREREKEEKRESKEFTDQINRNPNSFLEYNRRKEREIELLQTLPPSLSPFYKSKVTEYFNKIEQ